MIQVFVKHSLQLILDQMYEFKMSRYVTTMQARARATVLRKQYLRNKRKLILIQKWFRKCLAKKRFKARLTAYKSRIEQEQKGSEIPPFPWRFQ